MAGIENKFKVKLYDPRVGGRYGTVTFHVTPDVIENLNVNYKTLDPIHMPGTFPVYTNTAARTYNIGSIKLISRTGEEATKNLHTINVLRSWTKPWFGKSSLGKNQQNNRDSNFENASTLENFYNEEERNKILGVEMLGSPPAVLLLSAYSSPNNRGNIYKVPVVISNLSIPYPSDVDYIPTAKMETYKHIDENTPVPIVMTLDIQLMEAHSPNEYSNFNLADFRQGRLKGF